MKNYILPIRVHNNAADISSYTKTDDVTLEHDDRVLLRFTSDTTSLISGLESVGEHIRTDALVNINSERCF